MRESVVHEHHGGRISSAATLCLLGDIMTGRGIDQALHHPGDPRLYESYVTDAREYVHLAENRNGSIPQPVDPAYIWGDALQELDLFAPDVAVANLETSVTDSRTPWQGKGIHYKMHPRNVDCLTAAGLDCYVLANNHVMDWGRSGLEETLDTLSRAGLAGAGAGRDGEGATRPAAVPVGEHARVLVFGFGFEDSGIPSEWAAGPQTAGVWLLDGFSSASVTQVTRHIHAHRRAGDIVVASVHWGGNWGYNIPAEHRRFAHELIDKAGVDLVHGHSSHHVRPIEIHHGRLILYGCGDFLNDYEGIVGYERFRDDLALMYFVSLALPSGEMLQLRMRPMQRRKFRSNRAGEQDARWLADTLNRESGFLDAAVELDDDNTLYLLPV
ncbi:MAG: poly-gamma-glutamate biosynthesis protein [Chitinivibrionales bacterium]|nr:poly-gamma-glutamate biosynthesis protein [Chitinivibrionales bacterium]